MEMIFEGIPLAERHSKTRDLLIRDLLAELRWSVDADGNDENNSDRTARQLHEIYKAGFIAGYKTRAWKTAESK